MTQKISKPSLDKGFSRYFLLYESRKPVTHRVSSNPYTLIKPKPKRYAQALAAGREHRLVSTPLDESQTLSLSTFTNLGELMKDPSNVPNYVVSVQINLTAEQVSAFWKELKPLIPLLVCWVAFGALVLPQMLPFLGAASPELPSIERTQ